MAELIKSVLGRVNGKLNNLVFREMNDKNFISVRPKKYKPGKSQAAKDVRNNFAMTVALSKSVNSVPVLKKIWTESKAKGTNSYQKLMSCNVKMAEQGSLTTSNRITPAGLPLELNSASFENKNLHLSYYCPSNRYLKYPAVLFVYLFFKNENKSIVPVFASLEDSSPDGLYELEITLDSRTRKIISKDPEPIIYLALAGDISYKKRVYWTSTASLQV